MKLLQVFHHKLIIGLFVLLMPIVSRTNDFNPAVDPVLVDGQSYYEILDIPSNSTNDQIRMGFEQKITDLANQTKALLALAQDSQERNQIKKEVEGRMQLIRKIHSLFSVPSEKSEYDRALSFYQGASKAYIADKLSRPFVEFTKNATPGLKWKIELTNKTDEYLYAGLFNHISGKEIAPLSRSGKLLELTPQGSKDDTGRINNIELPTVLRLDIYDGSDRQEARLISSHVGLVGSSETMYLEIFNDGATLFPKSRKGKTPSGLSTSNNVLIDDITKLR